MSAVAIDDTTTRLLEGFARPGESLCTAIRRALTLACGNPEAPAPAWLARSIAVWLEFEGLETEGGAERLASHILNNWEMVRATTAVHA
jgi:hypothetical protein